ncbi:UDP-glucosyltransferase UGT13248-like [Triticum dicoccoides]|uniref:UDP-glucosyltransferase UGT13248-like n=1 Tax=Triticum dicoccoides TaxID=85692 RepID=UPI00189033DF|nr:UDP-glucosyltransferase UGT13248-like [Triticum dicoccoides]
MLARFLLLTDDVRVLVYDSHLPWARCVASEAGVAAAAFFTQMCAVDVLYGEVSAGRVALPLADGSALRGRLSVELGPNDVPPFVAAQAWYPTFMDSVLSQFDGLDQADHVLANFFCDLEPMVSTSYHHLDQAVATGRGAARARRVEDGRGWAQPSTARRGHDELRTGTGGRGRAR